MNDYIYIYLKECNNNDRNFWFFFSMLIKNFHRIIFHSKIKKKCFVFLFEKEFNWWVKFDHLVDILHDRPYTPGIFSLEFNLFFFTKFFSFWDSKKKLLTHKYIAMIIENRKKDICRIIFCFYRYALMLQYNFSLYLHYIV